MLLLLGCGGPNTETLVDQLRVMAVVAEPPEVAPGATTALTAYIADPNDEAPTTMMWTCTDLGDGCLEAAEPGLGATVAAPAAGVVTTTRVAPMALAGVVADGTTVLPIPLWTLACGDGLCPVIDDLTAGEDVTTFLTDPIEGMKDLPLLGTSLGFSFLRLGARVEPLQNPVLTPGFDAVEVDAGASLELPFTVAFTGVASAWGYTTAGGFEMTDFPVEAGAVSLTWIAPEEAGTATLWVVVVGEEGGTAVWMGEATIR